MRTICLFFSLMLSGCIAAETPESICEEFVRSVVTDPGSMKVNSTKTVTGALREDALEGYFEARYPDGLSEGAEKLMELRREEIAEAKDMFAEVDYTAQERGGPIRDRALCRYISWPVGSGTELVSLTIRNRDYSQDEFMAIFLNYGRPKGLSATYKIE